MRILSLEKYRGPKKKGYFHGLPREVQYVAYQWLQRFVARWQHNLPPWRLAILVGQAKRLALNSPTSEWGRSMLAKRGGLAVQRKYRLEGRHPTERATEVSLAKKRRAEAGKRDPESPRMRVVHLQLWD
jgi:hypothetical protein